MNEKEWAPALDGVVNDTLTRVLSPRDRFNLSAVWRPVPWAGPEWRFEVGPPVPPGATLVDRVRTMPVADGFRGLLEERMGRVNPGLNPVDTLNLSVDAVRLSLARVKIRYCETCRDYNTTAEKLERDLEDIVKSRDRVRLEPVREDVFEVVVNDVWKTSKAEIGRFPEPRDVNLQPETWEVRPDTQALAAEALSQRVRGLDLERARSEAAEWLIVEQLHPSRARVVLALWQ